MFIRPILIALLVLPRLLMSSIIIDTLQFGEILSHLKDDISHETLVVCDIDNTLLKGPQHLGSVAWGEYLIAQLERKGISKGKAEEIESILWKTVQPHITVENIDPKTADIINEIRKRHVPILGLTARSGDELDYTVRQLMSLGIDLQGNSHRYDKKWLTLEERKILYEKNILFCSLAIKKSAGLFKFLQEHDIHPKRIIFIDDKLSHIQDVALACKQQSIDYVGIRFGGADEHVNNFDPRIANLQWEAFPTILSDEQAQDMLNHQKKCSLPL